MSGLAGARIDMAAMTFRAEDTRTGEPLKLPVTRQFAAILGRRMAGRDRFPEAGRVFPSEIAGPAISKACST